MDKLLNYKEVAKLLGISVRFVQQMVKDGKLEAIRLGRRVLFSPESIKKLVQGN